MGKINIHNKWLLFQSHFQMVLWIRGVKFSKLETPSLRESKRPDATGSNLLCSVSLRKTPLRGAVYTERRKSWRKGRMEGLQQSASKLGALPPLCGFSQSCFNAQGNKVWGISTVLLLTSLRPPSPAHCPPPRCSFHSFLILLCLLFVHSLEKLNKTTTCCHWGVCTVICLTTHSLFVDSSGCSLSLFF